MRAIYAFSGDPITLGHIDVIERSAKIFHELIVGIGINPTKKYLFTDRERVQMAIKALSHIKNVKVEFFKGLLVDFAYERGAKILIRAARNTEDFVYEKKLYQIGSTQKLNLETFLMFAKQDQVHISSGSVKDLQQAQGLIFDLVTLNVKQELEKKVSCQYIVGITGEIGNGKSHIGNKFIEFGKTYDIPIHNIDIDGIAHKITNELPQSCYKKTRKKIIRTFGENIALDSDNYFINRKVLGEIVFGNQEKIQILNKIMNTSILVKIRDELFNKKGLIFLNTALLVEQDMLPFCNNNVLIVSVDKKTQGKRLKRRNLTDQQIESRINSQHPTQTKKEKIQEAIEIHNQGFLAEIKSRDDLTDKERMNCLIEIMNKVSFPGIAKIKEKRKPFWKRILSKV